MIIRSNSLHVPLKFQTAHCVITSPPYWGLRDYGVAGQLGLEKTPEEYIEKMVQVFREVWRVLRDDGTLFLNMGDSYARDEAKGQHKPGDSGKHNYIIEHGGGRASSQFHFESESRGSSDGAVGRADRAPVRAGAKGLKPKDLVGIPWRLAFALQSDGWYLRSDIIWSKPNPMPESVSGCAWERHRVKIKSMSKDDPRYRHGMAEHGAAQNCSTPTSTEWIACPGCPKCNPNDGYVLSWNAGRPTKSHEYIFLLTKSPHYFFDQEAVRENREGNTHSRGSKRHPPREDVGIGHKDWSKYMTTDDDPNFTTRNIRTVWSIATQPFPESHFATFPEELVRRCLFAGTSEKGCCPKCGGAWVRIIETQKAVSKECPKEQASHEARGGTGIHSGTVGKSGSGRIDGYTKTLGWRPSCKCGEERTVPGIVFDPFFGSGTVGVVAQKYNRRFIGLELKPEYCQMSKKRVYSWDIAMI